MSQPFLSNHKLEDSGVTDVRLVREKISSESSGNLKAHAAETERIVAPLIEKLGLKPGTPSQRASRRSGTGG